MRLFAVLAPLALVISACAPVPETSPEADNDQLAARYNVLPGEGVTIADYPVSAFNPARLDAFMQQAVVGLQRESFRIRAEICASVMVDRQGNYRLAHINPGTPASCSVDLAGPGELMVADFHTHGVYLPEYLNELPSPPDVITNQRSGVPGYVSTPAGRLWHVDNDSGNIRLVCPTGCLPVDPNTPASTRQPMPTTMTRADLFSQY